MNITNIVSQHKRTLSFEVFPPTTKDNLTSVLSTAKYIASLHPAYMSVVSRGVSQEAYTNCIVDTITNEHKVTALPHLTCVHATRESVVQQLARLRRLGVNNVLALRGDVPYNMRLEDKPYTYASDLVHDILCYDDSFCVGGACHPEGHPEARSLQDDIDNLKIKVDAGCSFLITQLFFQNNILYRYLDRLRHANITVPVVAGIMPFIDAKYLSICELSGIHVPPRLKTMVYKFAHKPKAMMEAGIAFAIEQLIDLYDHGIHAVHIYSMNNAEVAKRLRASVQDRLK